MIRLQSARRLAGQYNFRNDLRSDRREENSVSEMASGEDKIFQVSETQDGFMVRSVGPQSGPSSTEAKTLDQRSETRCRVEDRNQSFSCYGLFEPFVFNRRAGQDAPGRARHQVVVTCPDNQREFAIAFEFDHLPSARLHRERNPQRSDELCGPASCCQNELRRGKDRSRITLNSFHALALNVDLPRAVAAPEHDALPSAGLDERAAQPFVVYPVVAGNEQAAADARGKSGNALAERPSLESLERQAHARLGGEGLFEYSALLFIRGHEQRAVPAVADARSAQPFDLRDELGIKVATGRAEVEERVVLHHFALGGEHPCRGAARFGSGLARVHHHHLQPCLRKAKSNRAADHARADDDDVRSARKAESAAHRRQCTRKRNFWLGCYPFRRKLVRTKVWHNSTLGLNLLRSRVRHCPVRFARNAKRKGSVPAKGRRFAQSAGARNVR